jgi:mannose-6-phosphate isomerase-like protein (cupin superfamily)
VSEKKDKDIEDFKKEISEDIRPWGKFRSFPHKKAGNIKIITVNPGESLSLQYHHHRCEFWIALDEGLEITVGNQVWELSKNEEVFIPKKAPHRLRSVSKEPARVMEVWIGESAEDDIVRLEDKYNRLK